jgi:transcriptional pleiotropic regulator of transition state genes
MEARMKARGIVRRIDALGRLVIPKELRRKIEVNDGDEVEILGAEGCIIIKKYAPACAFCGSSEELVDFKDRKLCTDCLRELKALS